MKIVVDTNVLVSGILWKGNPFQVVDLWAKQKVNLLVSRLILDEYERILTALAKKYHNETFALKWLPLIAEDSILIEAPHHFTGCNDPDDNKFVDCAVAGKAEFIISGDQDLLDLQSVLNISVVTPTEFLTVFKSRQ